MNYNHNASKNFKQLFIHVVVKSAGLDNEKSRVHILDKIITTYYYIVLQLFV